MLFYLIALNSAGSLYGAAEQKEFFCKRGLARIRVRDDGECFALIYFVNVFHDLMGAKVRELV